MRKSRNKLRMFYSMLVITAFFIPAYENISAFSFTGLILSAMKADMEVTVVDLLILLMPLCFILISAMVIFYKAARQMHINGLLLSLPLFFLCFFILVLSLAINMQGNNTGLMEFIREVSFGFYISIMASVLLLLSYSKSEALNFQ